MRSPLAPAVDLNYTGPPEALDALPHVIYSFVNLTTAGDRQNLNFNYIIWLAPCGCLSYVSGS